MVGIIVIAWCLYYDHLQDQKSDFIISARGLIRAYLNYLSFLNNSENSFRSAYVYLNAIKKEDKVTESVKGRLKEIYIKLEEIQEKKDRYQPSIDNEREEFNKVSRQTKLNFTTLERDLFNVLCNEVVVKKSDLNFYLDDTRKMFDTSIKELNVSEEERSDVYKEIYKAWEDVKIHRAQEFNKFCENNHIEILKRK